METSSAEMPRAAMREGSSHTRMAKVCPAQDVGGETPSTVDSIGCTTRAR